MTATAPAPIITTNAPLTYPLPLLTLHRDEQTCAYQLVLDTLGSQFFHQVLLSRYQYETHLATPEVVVLI